VDWLNPASAPVKATEFLLDIGTAEVPVTLKPLREGFARLHLAEPVLALPGDRFILRRPSPALTVAGGTVMDVFPNRRLNREKTFERLTRLAGATAAQRIEMLVDESANGLSVAQVVRLMGLTPEVVAKTPNLILVNGQQLVSKKWIELRRRKLLEWLQAFHAKNPTAAGAPISQARLGIESALLSAVLNQWSAVEVRGDLVSLAGHKPQILEADTKALAQIELVFRQGAFQPPAPAQFLTDKNARGHLETLVKSGRLIRVSADLIFHVDVIAHIRGSLAAHKGRRFSVADFKSWTKISRKYAIPLLEYLDQLHVTKREGDERVVL
jgi:selenocysteine-specific elongation factor